MSELVRLSISLEKELLTQLDSIVAGCGSTNRSEFIRDLVRNRLSESSVNMDEVVIGTVTLFSKARAYGLSDRIAMALAQKPLSVLNLVTTPIDQTKQLVIILVIGKASDIRKLVETLSTQKNIIQATSSFTGLNNT